MHRRLWLLAGAAAAVVARGGVRDCATTKVAGSAQRRHVVRGAVCPGMGERAADDGRPQGEERSSSSARSRTSSASTPSSTCCNQFWAASMARAEALRGAYNIDNKRQYVKDLVSSAKATKTTLSYTIRPDANWNWGGKKIPVTYKDFVYTWQQLVDPKNDVAGRTATTRSPATPTRATSRSRSSGRSRMRATGRHLLRRSSIRRRRSRARTSTRSGRTASAATTASPSPTARSTLTNYTKGQGTTLKANPFWYGKKPRLNEVDFKIITDTNTEVQAMRGGEVDAINPTFGINLLPLKSDAGRHVQPGAGPLPGAHRHPVRPAGAAAPARAVDAAGDHDGHRPPVDHQDGVRRARGQHEAARQPRLLPGRRGVQARLREVELQPDEGARAAEEALHRRSDRAEPSATRPIWTCAGYPAHVPLHVDGVERDAHDAGGDHQGRS